MPFVVLVTLIVLPRFIDFRSVAHIGAERYVRALPDHYLFSRLLIAGP